jgi:hypothetical protein
VSVSSGIRQTAGFVLIGLLTVVVLTMAWTRFAAAIQFLPVERDISDYYKSRSLPATQIDSMLAQTALATAKLDHYSYHSALSLLYYLQATSPGTGLNLRREKLDQSIAEARISLSAAPMQPELWLRIVQAGFLSFLPHNELAPNYQMAIWSGRVEPTHLIQRLQVGLALERSLDEVGLNLLRDQALLAWNLKQPEVSRAIRNGQINRARLEALLRESHPDVVADMERVLGPFDP